MSEKNGAEKVEKYYDRTTASYLATYGSTIQAYRPSNAEDLHQHVLDVTGIDDGMDVLDVGCGVAGPAVFFASKKAAKIEGITISQVQINEGSKAVSKANLKGSVILTKGDFHNLKDYYENTQFDVVLFLESLGHSIATDGVLKDAFDLVKPGGCIYIKDFYPLEIDDETTRAKHQAVLDRINEAYSYNVLDLNDTLKGIRRAGFEIDFVKRFEFADDIEARSAFETANGIDLYEGQSEFIVAEWLEIKCTKPVHPLF